MRSDNLSTVLGRFAGSIADAFVNGHPFDSPYYYKHSTYIFNSIGNLVYQENSILNEYLDILAGICEYLLEYETHYGYDSASGAGGIDKSIYNGWFGRLMNQAETILVPILAFLFEKIGDQANTIKSKFPASRALKILPEREQYNKNLKAEVDKWNAQQKAASAANIKSQRHK
jgi:hypothetical protein